ncbi:serine protease [Armillaria borealis]|uniref:Serine protease n=1 Tax=Armillaria borealis TaxID=47425 RepID=A0AA39JHB4_9AGAR|nr:serine protease [Armillaria borealis]
MASTQPDTTTLTDITALTKLQRIDGKVKKDNYIVTLRPGVARSTRDTLVDSLGPEATITARYNHVFSGFAGQFSSGVLERIHAHPDVVTIVEDSEVYANVEQHDATWGLQRISQEGPLPPGSDPLSDTLPSISAYLNSTTLSALTYTYTYDGTVTSLVNIYVLDTGIYTENSDFGGRAHWGVTMIGSDGDRRGHGTHVAGTIGGTRFGVYKFAEIYDVKVLDDNGAGTASSVIAGLDWTHNNVLRPAVVNMSLGSPANTAIDSAVVAVINSGITTVVSAGNTNIDASLRSPARVEQAITVGASTIADARASFSNFGFDHFPISSMYLLSVRLSIRSVVDVFAPGQDITSTWIGQVDATHTISGTSMAAPHVTGVAAYFLAQQTDLRPSEIEEEIEKRANEGILSNIPAGTVNALLYNGTPV